MWPILLFLVLVLSQAQGNISDTDWIEVGEKHRDINFRLLSTPLQIYTTSKTDSKELIWLDFLNSKMQGVGLSIRFGSTPRYNLGCCEVKNILNLGSDDNRVWTLEIDNTNKRVKLDCNGEPIFNVHTPSSAGANNCNCETAWSRDISYMRFVDGSKLNTKSEESDTASKLYRPFKQGNHHNVGVFEYCTVLAVTSSSQKCNL